jgi:hypothetical protein
MKLLDSATYRDITGEAEAKRRDALRRERIKWFFRGVAVFAILVYFLV